MREFGRNILKSCLEGPVEDSRVEALLQVRDPEEGEHDLLDVCQA